MGHLGRFAWDVKRTSAARSSLRPARSRSFRIRSHKLKIDRTFIQDLSDSSDDAAIATAIINMAKCLKLRVTAEGVERAGQLSQLRKYVAMKPKAASLASPYRPLKSRRN